MTVPFCALHSICLNIGFWNCSFAWKYGSPVFQKCLYFKVIVMKVFKILICYNRKTCWSLRRRSILKIPSTIFRGTYVISVGFKVKPFLSTWRLLFKNTSVTQCNYIRLFCLDTNQKQPRFYLIINSCRLNCPCSFPCEYR